MESEKTCPKWANFPRMDKLDGMKTMIPAIAGDQNDLITSGTIGVPVEVYRCPQCHLVELYEVNNEQLCERDANNRTRRISSPAAPTPASQKLPL
jgi:hypothetical protein